MGKETGASVGPRSACTAVPAESVSTLALVTPTKARPATVTYTAGLLSVLADDSSLNQILRQIAQLTGMTIRGGVEDERVFGKYNPATPSAVVSALLQGTCSTMLLREGSNAAPIELILTPQGSLVMPPGPNSSGFDGKEDSKHPVAVPLHADPHIRPADPKQP